MDLFNEIDKALNIKENQLTKRLMQKPKKDTGVNQAHFTQTTEGVQQADLLSLPNDNGYRWALVVVDVATRACDAEPLKSKSASEITKAFGKIYSRSLLSKPFMVQSDPGSEFKGETAKYLKRKGIMQRVGQPGRHRQQAIVEKYNLYIGKSIYRYQNAMELQTGETFKEWKDQLPTIIRILNSKLKRKPKKDKLVDAHPVCKGDSCNLLREDQKVRVALDEPRDISSNKKLHGGFRAGDIRFEKKPREIDKVLIEPGKPPLYTVDGKEHVAYTKNQLQQVKESDKVKVNRPKTYEVKNFTNKKKYNGRIMFKVLWKGYPRSESTWEYRNELIKDIGEDTVKELEKGLRK